MENNCDMNDFGYLEIYTVLAYISKKDKTQEDMVLPDKKKTPSPAEVGAVLGCGLHIRGGLLFKRMLQQTCSLWWKNS